MIKFVVNFEIKYNEKFSPCNPNSLNKFIFTFQNYICNKNENKNKNNNDTNNILYLYAIITLSNLQKVILLKYVFNRLQWSYRVFSPRKYLARNRVCTSNSFPGWKFWTSPTIGSPNFRIARRPAKLTRDHTPWRNYMSRQIV